MVAESTPENSVVRQSFIGTVTFKKTLEYSDGLSHPYFRRKSKLDPENIKCNIRRCLQQGVQSGFVKDYICITKPLLMWYRYNHSALDQQGASQESQQTQAT